MARDTVHPVMKKALALTEASDHPKNIHAAGPAVRIVKFEGAACLSIAAWQTGLLASTLEEGERPRFDKWMTMATASPQPSYDAMRPPNVAGSPAVQAASHCVYARGAMAGGYDSRAASHASDVTALLVRHLGKDHDALRAFLVELDDRLMGYELAAAAREKGGPEFAEFERVLFRGADAKENCVLWVARVKEGLYAILSKVGARWRWSEGSRDDALSSVPDAMFAVATREALLRDVPIKVKLRLPKKAKDKGNFWTADSIDRT